MQEVRVHGRHQVCSLQEQRRIMGEYNCHDCEVQNTCSINMNEKDGLRLTECLRGRLLAERQASKMAKQNADLLRERVMELEIMLQDEIKLRNRAEKKLRILQKKLEALRT